MITVFPSFMPRMILLVQQRKDGMKVRALVRDNSIIQHARHDVP